ncbi:hypothetical protein MKX01_017908, partial [Papaver californicum]
HFDASSGTTTTSVDTTMATNSTSSSPPRLLKNSSNNNQRKTKRGEKSFSNSSLLLVDLPRGGEFVNTNDNSHDNSIGTASNFSASSITPNDAKKQEKSCDSSDVNRKPYHPPGSCPFIEQTFACYQNGRPDDKFL